MYEYFKTLWTNPAAARKFYATVIGLALMIATTAMTGDLTWAQWAVAVLTALSTYAVRNDKAGDNNGN